MTSVSAPENRPHLRAAIIDAAAQLLQEGGGPAVTTRAVAQLAGIPAPTIFRLFGDKDGLMDAVAEQVMATYVAAKAAEVVTERGDPIAQLRSAWNNHIDFGLTNPDLFTLLITRNRSQHSPASITGVGVLDTRVARAAEAGLLRVSPARAVGMIHAAGSGVILALLSQPDERCDRSLADETFDAVLGAILASRPAPPASDLVALAITFASAVPDLPALSPGERLLLREWLARSIAELERPQT